jgi:cell division transport system ATP-binding protein
MIRFSQVDKRYISGYEALKGINLHLPRASMTFLTGHSGAGKSTLLKLITAAEKPTRGQVLVQDQNVSRLHGNRKAYFRRKIGCVFQDHKLLYDR